VFITAVFNPVPGKNDPHIRVLAAFPGFGWDKLNGKNSLGLRAFGDQ
jgi:hypothetical protein